MRKDFDAWTDTLEYEDAFFDSLEQVKKRAETDSGWLYIESVLYAELNALVRVHDSFSEKHIKATTEMLMKYLLKDQYMSKTHKPAIGNLPLTKIRKQNKREKNSFDSRKSTRLIFVKRS